MTRLDTPEAMLAELVAMPSPSSADPRFDLSNRAVVDWLADRAASLGARVDVERVGDRDKWNVIARFGTGEGAYILSGHTDTVPWDDHGWSSDPFELTERDGELFGLGATDMKAFFPAALHAIARLGGRYARPIVLLGTADEESTMSGARALLAEGTLRGAGLVIGEPTDLRPVSAHKGVAHQRVVLEGRAGHASDPALGASALDAMVPVLEALLRHRDALASQRDDRFAVPQPTLNLGRIAGGDSVNRICATCSVDVDLRLLPGTTLESAASELRRVVREAVRDPRIVARVEPLFDGVPPFATPLDAEILALACRITGEEPVAVSFATEAPLLQALGVPAVVLGPGSIDTAHQPNERVPRAALHRAIDVYEAILRDTPTEEGRA